MALREAFYAYNSGTNLPLTRPPWRYSLTPSQNPQWMLTLGPISVGSGNGALLGSGKNYGGNWFEAVPFAADQSSEVTVHPNAAYWNPGSSDYVGAAVRCGETNGYFVKLRALGGTSMFFFGADENPIGATFTGPAIAPGDRVKLSVVGTTLSVYHNDQLLATRTNGVIAAGQPGIFLQSTSNDLHHAELQLYAWEGTSLSGAEAGGPFPAQPFPSAFPVAGYPQQQWV